MFGIGFGELLIILLIALVVVGPDRLPDLARWLGNAIHDLRRMYDNLRADLGPDFDEVEKSIRTLRSLDPRRELDLVGRKVFDGLANDIGPEAEALLRGTPAQLEASVKEALRLDPAAPAPSAPAGTVPVEAVVNVPAVATDSASRPAVASSSSPPPAAPQPDPAVARLTHDLLSDDLLDRPLTGEPDQVSSNGHGPA